MCGLSARTVRSSSTAGRAGVEAALGGGDLLGVGGQRLVLLGELELARRAQVERPDDQLAAELGEAGRRASRSRRSGSIGVRS